MREAELRVIKESILGTKRSTEPALRQLLNHLDNEQIINLEEAIRSKDEYTTNCVRHFHTSTDVRSTARFLLQASFRNHTKKTVLIRLPWCNKIECINPFHFMATTRENVELNSVELILSQYKPPMRWASCRLWHEKTRIGQSFVPTGHFFTIVGNSAAATMSNSTMILAAISKNKPILNSILKKVTNGLTIWTDGNQTWLYNRDILAYFFQAKTGSKPVKLAGKTCTSLANTATLTISIAKGWGVDYKRACITDCPLWLEINFNI